MTTGRQIKEARGLLSWSRSKLATKARVSLQTIRRAESGDEDAVTIAHAALIRRALESGGVEFTYGATHGVKPRGQPLDD